MPVVRNLLTGTATKYVLLAVNIASGVLLLPFTIRHLGTDQYGLWMLAASFTYYLQLLDLGYGAGVVRHVTDADARGDIDGVNRVLSTFLVVYSALGIVAVIVMGAMVLWIVPRFPRLTPQQVWDAQAVLAILGARIAIGLPMSVFGAATTARQRFALNNGVAIVVAVLNALVTYLVLSAGYGLIPLVASTAALGVVSYVAYARTARIAMPELRLRPSSFSLPLVREVTTFSLYLFVISIAAHIWFNLDSLVIGAALGTSAVAIYAVAFRLADYQRQLCSQFNDLLFPVVVRMGASDPREAMAAMLIDSTRVALSLVAIVSICVIGFGAPLIELWLGTGFDGAVLPLYVLALAGVAMVGLGPVGVFLLGTGRHRLVALCAVTEAVCNLVLSLLLVGPLGTFGVALGTAIPVTLVHVLILMPAACRDTSMPVTTFLRGVVRAPLAGSVPAVGVWTLLTAWVPPASLWMMFIQSAAVGAVYAAAVWSVGLERTTRTRYAAHLREAARWTRTLPQWSGAA